MSKRFKHPEVGDRRPRCPECGILLNGTMPYCSQICEDSKDAAMKREFDRFLVGNIRRG